LRIPCDQSTSCRPCSICWEHLRHRGSRVSASCRCLPEPKPSSRSTPIRKRCIRCITTAGAILETVGVAILESALVGIGAGKRIAVVIHVLLRQRFGFAFQFSLRLLRVTLFLRFALGRRRWSLSRRWREQARLRRSGDRGHGWRARRGRYRGDNGCRGRRWLRRLRHCWGRGYSHRRGCGRFRSAGRKRQGRRGSGRYSCTSPSAS